MPGQLNKPTRPKRTVFTQSGGREKYGVMGRWSRIAQGIRLATSSKPGAPIPATQAEPSPSRSGSSDGLSIGRSDVATVRM